jgi:hypothetical protein
MDFSTRRHRQTEGAHGRLVREEIMPRDSDPRQTAHGPTEEFRRELIALGRRAGLLSSCLAGQLRERHAVRQP